MYWRKGAGGWRLLGFGRFIVSDGLFPSLLFSFFPQGFWERAAARSEVAFAHEAQGEYTGCEKGNPRGHDLSVIGEGHAEIGRYGGGEALGGLGHSIWNEGDGYG